MKKAHSFLFVTAVVITAVFLSLAGGCTEYERRGYSPLPHNRPAAWESRPYGDMRN